NDCQIVTDMELLFPDHYISNATERIHLYRKLDNMKQEEELQTFEHELTDRFGKLPPPSKDLLEVVRLRWLAMDLGFEKLILKNRHMIAYFVTDQESPYYQSPVFKNILENIQKDHKKYNLEEKNNKLTLSFNNITDIYKAWDALSEIYQKQKATVE
ncbi:MAG: TRCF domain-containing protein, partial [Bacteroidota bacterium]